jgi:cyclase
MSTYQAPPAKMKKLVEGVYAYLQPFVYYSSNAGLIVGNKYAVVVDTLTNKYMIESFIARIKEFTDKPVRFVINTHPHGDHTYTNHFFTEAAAICSARCREYTLKMPPDYLEKARREIPEMSFDGAKDTPQDIVFDKTLTIYQDDREIRLIHLGPGHSPSDAYVFLPQEHIVFCGDILFSGTPPLSIAGSVSRHIEQLETIARLDAEIYVAGHGPITGKEHVYDSRDYLVKVLTEARRCYDRGLSYLEAANSIDMGKEEWSAQPIFRLIGLCARAYSEFRGEEPATPLDVDLTALLKKK